MGDIDFIPRAYDELVPVVRMFGGIIHVGFTAAASSYAPESLDVWLTVVHARTGNTRTWQVDAGNWRGAVREAKRLLNEWRISGRREPVGYEPPM